MHSSVAACFVLKSVFKDKSRRIPCYVGPSPPVSITASTVFVNNFLKGRGAVKCVKKVKGKRGKPDRIELLVNKDLVK